MKIICIGRNYAEHAAELNNSVPDEIVFFLKPDTAVLPKGKEFFIPEFSQDIHHEIELVYKICREGKHIEPQFAHRYYDQITVGIDFTARDIQQKQKEKGLPWEPAKAFDYSCPVGDFISLEELKNPGDIHFTLKVNGEIRQNVKSSMMLNNIDSIISFVSKYITLRKGDLIYTGTPKGVAAVKPGDILEGFLDGKKLLEVKVK